MRLYIFWTLILFAGCVLCSALLFAPKFAQLAAARRLPARRVAQKKRRIALVIPARNESRIIGDLFESIRRQTYARELLEVNVIVKDEADETVALAREYGARVYVVPAQSCKGDALDGYFRRALRESKAEAFAIVDADAVLAPDFAEELNNALEYDRQIFETRKSVKNFLGGRERRSVVCNCSALVYPMEDDCGNVYRAEKGVPLHFIGQGLMLRREVIEALGGWPYRSLTEDYELKTGCLLHGFTSMYYPHAVLYTEEVVRHAESMRRRLRWVTGYSQCDKVYRERVKEKFAKEKSPAAARYDFLTGRRPIFFYLASCAWCMLAGLVLLLYGLPREGASALLALLPVFLPAAFTYFVLFLYGAAIMRRYQDAMGRLTAGERLCALLYFPVFILEFIPIYFKSRRAVSRHRESAWEETERQEAMSGE